MNTEIKEGNCCPPQLRKKPENGNHLCPTIRFGGSSQKPSSCRVGIPLKPWCLLDPSVTFLSAAHARAVALNLPCFQPKSEMTRYTNHCKNQLSQTPRRTQTSPRSPKAFSRTKTPVLGQIAHCSSAMGYFHQLSYGCRHRQ